MIWVWVFCGRVCFLCGCFEAKFERCDCRICRHESQVAIFVSVSVKLAAIASYVDQVGMASQLEVWAVLRKNLLVPPTY
jgi:hypothetical protein